MRKWEK